MKQKQRIIDRDCGFDKIPDELIVETMKFLTHDELCQGKFFLISKQFLNCFDQVCRIKNRMPMAYPTQNPLMFHFVMTLKELKDIRCSCYLGKYLGKCMPLTLSYCNDCDTSHCICKFKSCEICSKDRCDFDLAVCFICEKMSCASCRRLCNFCDRVICTSTSCGNELELLHTNKKYIDNIICKKCKECVFRT